MVAGSATLFAYLSARWISSAAGSPSANALVLLRIEEALGLRVEQSVQRAALLHAPWLVDGANIVYTWAFWPMLAGGLMRTWRADRHAARLLGTTLAITAGAGFLLQAFFPVLPPRLMPGYTDTVSSSSLLRAVAHPAIVSNPHAAFPSFHVGWWTLSLQFLVPGSRRGWEPSVRWMATAAMSAAVVLTANHWMVDILAGLALCRGGLRIAERRCGPSEQSWASAPRQHRCTRASSGSSHRSRAGGP